MKQRHWQACDFVVTSTSPAYDGKPGVNRFGYCAKCKADMQSFCHDSVPQPIKHYSSHGAARALGLWSGRR